LSCANLKSVPEESQGKNHPNWAGFWLTHYSVITLLTHWQHGGEELRNVDELWCFIPDLECIIVTWSSPLVQSEVMSPWSGPLVRSGPCFSQDWFCGLKMTWALNTCLYLKAGS
jgi:hypothetical protein